MKKQQLEELMKQRDPLKQRPVVEPVDLYQVPASEKGRGARSSSPETSRTLESSEPRTPGLSDPRPLEVDPSEEKIGLGTQIYPTRKRQLEFEHYLTGEPEW